MSCESEYTLSVHCQRRHRRVTFQLTSWKDDAITLRSGKLASRSVPVMFSVMVMCFTILDPLSNAQLDVCPTPFV